MNPYSILGISEGASEDEIKKAFRRKAHEHHPDKGGDPLKFKEVQRAYEALTKNRSYQSQSDTPFEYGFRTTYTNEAFNAEWKRVWKEVFGDEYERYTKGFYHTPASTADDLRRQADRLNELLEKMRKKYG